MECHQSAEAESTHTFRTRTTSTPFAHTYGKCLASGSPRLLPNSSALKAHVGAQTAAAITFKYKCLQTRAQPLTKVIRTNTCLLLV